MGIPIPINQYPQKISGTAARPYLLINDSASASTVYIGQNSGVSPNGSYALKLTPGSSITWTDITSEVWGVTTANGSAAVTAAYEASGTFTTTPAAINGANPTLIKTITSPFTHTSGTATQIPATTADLAISGYNSVLVMVSVNYTSVTGTSNISNSGSTQSPNFFTGSFINVGGVQYDSAYAGTDTSGFARTNSALFSFGDGIAQTTGLSSAIQTYQFSINNSLLAFKFDAYLGANVDTLAGTITYRIYGTNQVLNSDQYKNWPSPNLRTPGTPAGSASFAITLFTAPASNVLLQATANAGSQSYYINLSAITGSKVSVTFPVSNTLTMTQYVFQNPTTLISSIILNNVSGTGSAILTGNTIGNYPLDIKFSTFAANQTLTIVPA